MTQENQVEQPAGEPEVKQEVQETREFTVIEQKALEQGWVPKDEFEGDETTFIDAPEFVRRGELFSKIEHQSKELKEVRKALESFKQHHTRVKEVEYERALKALQQAKRKAMVEGEHEQFFALEEREEEVKAEKAAFETEAKQPIVQEQETPVEFTNWVEKNSWYSKDRAMRAVADTLGIDLAKQGMKPADVLKEVEQLVRKEFPHKFRNEKASRPSAVEAPSRSGTTKSADSGYKLDETEHRIGMSFVRQGLYKNIGEYAAELKKIKER